MRKGRKISISVQDLHLDYELFEDRRAALRDRLVKRQGTGRSVVKAIRGVSFDVREGGSVGIVGSNGSGKSTLLAAIAGLIPPTSGEILVSEDPKLLGVGATLVPASTGWRNIRLGCLALGMPHEEIEERMPEIGAFTELGEALDRPLRTYSSGMRARLHFSIATAVDPKILLIDEALAVGDQAFRLKSSKRIKELLGQAGTLLLVSHSSRDIKELCGRAIWLDRGRVMEDGRPRDVLAHYEKATT
jgi:teichoic acid transport system ATP-binding protein